jgi:tRNA-dihydrouridine synthase 2
LIGAQVRHNPRAGTIEFTRIPSQGGKAKTVEEKEAQEVAPPGKESVIYRLHPVHEAGKLIFQIGSASPELAVKAATLVAPYCSGIDLNSGCPKPFSTSGGMGAALLSTPDLLCEILEALVKEVGEKFEIGISVKIRLLSTAEETRGLVEKLVKTGITGLTIHCRTRSMRKTEKAIREQLKMVGDICREAGVACLMNGDVESREQAQQLAKDYEVDGAMIATAAEKDPSVFRAAADGGKAEWRTIVQEYMHAAIDVENRWGNTKFLLAQMMPGKELNKRGIAQAKNYEHVCEKLELGDEELTEKARKLDAMLDLTNRELKSTQKAQKAQQGQKGSNNKVKQKKNEAKRPAENATSTAEVADAVVEVEREAKKQKRSPSPIRKRSLSPRQKDSSSPKHSTEYNAELRQENHSAAMTA